jgi:hypothetical protein
MSKKEAERFVIAMIEAGSDIQAIDRRGYVVIEPVDLQDRQAHDRIEAVASRFPNRDHIEQDIIDYLNAIGRVVPTN